MKTRCTNSNYKGWKNYGGKGVRVYAEWSDSYEVFKAWALANGFRDDLTLDRIDSNGDYEPDNCQWVTVVENNQRMHAARGHTVCRMHQ